MTTVSDASLPSGDYTVECWVKVTSDTSAKGVHRQMLDDLRKDELADMHGDLPKIPGRGYFEDFPIDSNR